jgi:hypothetical protein
VVFPTSGPGERNREVKEDQVSFPIKERLIGSKAILSFMCVSAQMNSVILV